MAVMRGTNLPEDAVVLNELDATNYAWEFVANWEKKSDTWALRFGPTALGAINGLSGIIINNHYRKKLKLAHYGFLASVIPISIMPAVLTPLFHRHLISTRMLLMKDEACPICYEMRSTAIQFGFGIVYPMVLGPLASLMFTHRYGTARIPDLTEGPKVIYNFIKKLTRPFTGTLAFLTGIQLAASAVITYYELKNNITLQNEIVEIERKAEAEDRLKKLNR